MKHLTLATLGFAALFLSAYPNIANAYEAKYVALLSPEQKMVLTNYLNYEEREPCQNYRVLPQNFYLEGCTLQYNFPQSAVQDDYIHAEGLKNANVLASYNINFAFDSSAMDATSLSTLDLIAVDIKRFNPREVVVSGHTDTAGTSRYNLMLSQRRANATSRELDMRGVANRTINKMAFGEEQLAIATNDGIALRENRRVIIQFLK